MAFAGLALFMAAACDADRPSARMDVLVTTFDTINGVVHVANTGDPPAWQLVPVVSIGPREITDEAGPEEFGAVSTVALGPGGEVYVGDAINREVRVFGLDGVHLRTFGREGEGPGEFLGIYSLAWVGDRLLSYDGRLGRIGQSTAEGEWLGQYPMRAGWTGSAAQLRIYQVGEDEFWHLDLSTELERSWVGYLGGSLSGDTIPFMFADDLPGMVEGIFCESEQMIGYYEAPFAASHLQHPASGGVMVSAWGYDYRIAVTMGAGDTLRVIERTLPPVPISDEEWAEGNPEFNQVLERFPDIECNPRGFTRPDRKPFVHALYVAPDGQIWVEAIRQEGNRFEFFDADGQLLGSVPAPAYNENSVPAFSGDLIATIREDEIELDHVDVWRLERVR